MLESANEARKRATLAASALRLVNEAAAGPLIGAAERGESSVLVEIDAAELPGKAGMLGRVNDEALIELFDVSGQIALAHACRIFAALGFSLSTVPEVELDEGVGHVGEVVRSIRVTYIELGFGAAQATGLGAHAALLQSVVLPAAHLWRSRAESGRRLQQLERSALSHVSRSVEQGSDTCRFTWRDLSSGPLNPLLMQQLTESLKLRGFRVDQLEAGSTLRLRW
jgi:hypothetical protein